MKKLSLSIIIKYNILPITLEYGLIEIIRENSETIYNIEYKKSKYPKLYF